MKPRYVYLAAIALLITNYHAIAGVFILDYSGMASVDALSSIYDEDNGRMVPTTASSTMQLPSVGTIDALGLAVTSMYIDASFGVDAGGYSRAFSDSSPRMGHLAEDFARSSVNISIQFSTDTVALATLDLFGDGGDRLIVLNGVEYTESWTGLLNPGVYDVQISTFANASSPYGETDYEEAAAFIQVIPTIHASEPGSVLSATAGVLLLLLYRRCRYDTVHRTLRALRK